MLSVFDELLLALGVTAGAVVVGMLYSYWQINRQYYPRHLKWPKVPLRDRPLKRGGRQS
jgi:hypothetical protein